MADLAVTKPEKLPQRVFSHDVWVKPVTEFQRSRRLSALMGKDGSVDQDALRMARIYTIVDHLCDKDGGNIFKEGDVKDLLELDALKIDMLTSAIEEWVSKREGKLQGESKN